MFHLEVLCVSGSPSMLFILGLPLLSLDQIYKLRSEVGLFTCTGFCEKVLVRSYLLCASHRKQMLDEDKRELLRYQEMYLPDGDLYSGGKGRMRRFAWKNMGK